MNQKEMVRQISELSSEDFSLLQSCITLSDPATCTGASSSVSGTAEAAETQAKSGLVTGLCECQELEVGGVEENSVCEWLESLLERLREPAEVCGCSNGGTKVLCSASQLADPLTELKHVGGEGEREGEGRGAGKGGGGEWRRGKQGSRSRGDSGGKSDHERGDGGAVSVRDASCVKEDSNSTTASHPSVHGLEAGYERSAQVSSRGNQVNTGPGGELLNGSGRICILHNACEDEQRVSDACMNVAEGDFNRTEFEKQEVVVVETKGSEVLPQPENVSKGVFVSSQQKRAKRKSRRKRKNDLHRSNRQLADKKGEFEHKHTTCSMSKVHDNITNVASSPVPDKSSVIPTASSLPRDWCRKSSCGDTQPVKTFHLKVSHSNVVQTAGDCDRIEISTPTAPAMPHNEVPFNYSEVVQFLWNSKFNYTSMHERVALKK